MDSSLSALTEKFAALDGLPVLHAFLGRVPGVDVRSDRATALARLDEHHRGARHALGLDGRTFVTAEQVHGCVVAALASGEDLPAAPVPGADGLVTDRIDVCLGIYVADCGPLYLVDPKRRVVGLVHSGRKGTELGVAAAAVRTMAERFGSVPADLVAPRGPCIRPPWYEPDFAAELVRQLRTAGVGRVEDCGTCTASNPDQYYSYRREKGQTGRMLALIALR